MNNYGCNSYRSLGKTITPEEFDELTEYYYQIKEDNPGTSFDNFILTTLGVEWYEVACEL